jgi:hypothetical protein
MSKKVIAAISFSLCVASSMNAFAGSTPTITHDGRYIYTRLGWDHWTRDEQSEVIDQSVQMLEGTIKVLGTNNVVKTLSNTVLTPSVMDELTAKLQSAVYRTDNFKWLDLLPPGILIYGGGSIAGGWGVYARGGLDVGIVIVPQSVTIQDTWGKEATYTKHEVSMEFVAIPHGHIGLGADDGAGWTFGAAAITGNINDAHEFHGAVGGGGVDLKFLAGADFEARGVYNSDEKKLFGLFGIAGDIGPEAAAGLDGEGGDIMPLGAYLAKQGMAPDKTAKLTQDLDQQMKAYPAISGAPVQK